MGYNGNLKLDKILSKMIQRKESSPFDYFDNILFLDYDGVLNTNGTSVFSKDCMSNLNRLCLKYQFKIVVISSWRKYLGYQDMLYDSGLDPKIEILGKTDCFNSTRELEVKRYLWEHPYIDKFLILDDGDFEELKKYQVKTEFLSGFDNKKYLEAESLMKKLYEKNI